MPPQSSSCVCDVQPSWGIIPRWYVCFAPNSEPLTPITQQPRNTGSSCAVAIAHVASLWSLLPLTDYKPALELIVQATAVRRMSLASQVPPTPLPHSITVSGSYCRPPALDGTRWHRTNEHATVAGLHDCGSPCFALVIHGAAEREGGTDGGADEFGKQPVARPAQSVLRFDGIGP